MLHQPSNPPTPPPHHMSQGGTHIHTHTHIYIYTLAYCIYYTTDTPLPTHRTSEVVVDSFAESRQKDLLQLAEELEHENEQDKKHLETCLRWPCHHRNTGELGGGSKLSYRRLTTASIWWELGCRQGHLTVCSCLFFNAEMIFRQFPAISRWLCWNWMMMFCQV